MVGVGVGSRPRGQFRIYRPGLLGRGGLVGGVLRWGRSGRSEPPWSSFLPQEIGHNGTPNSLTIRTRPARLRAARAQGGRGAAADSGRPGGVGLHAPGSASEVSRSAAPTCPASRPAGRTAAGRHRGDGQGLKSVPSLRPGHGLVGSRRLVVGAACAALSGRRWVCGTRWCSIRGLMACGGLGRRADKQVSPPRGSSSQSRSATECKGAHSWGAPRTGRWSSVRQAGRPVVSAPSRAAGRSKPNYRASPCIRSWGGSWCPVPICRPWSGARVHRGAIHRRLGSRGCSGDVAAMARDEEFGRSWAPGNHVRGTCRRPWVPRGGTPRRLRRVPIPPATGALQLAYPGTLNRFREALYQQESGVRHITTA